LYSWKSEQLEIGWECSYYRKVRNTHRIYVRKPLENKQLGDQVAERIRGILEI
jgi:hypothetical protein